MTDLSAAVYVISGALLVVGAISVSPRVASFLCGLSLVRTSDAFREGAALAQALFGALGRVPPTRGPEAMAVLQECTQQLRELGGDAR